MADRKPTSTEAWLSKVRGHFVRIAMRRVDAADVEDVVQDAIRILLEKRVDPAGRDDLPHLAWCFQVLRNVISNHYRREETRRRWVDGGSEPDSEGSGQAIESLDAMTTLWAIEDALATMSRENANCARYLTRLVEGMRASEVADEEGIEAAVFYRRLYRCRKALRDLLAAKGVMT